MSPTLTCLALALAGVDLGYQPASDGGAEFILQINPTTLGALRPGERIDIDVPREAREMRPSHFTISLGDERLPRVAPPATAPIVNANPVIPATAASTVPPNVPSAAAPILPPSSPSSQAETSAAQGESRIAKLPEVNGTGKNPTQPDQPWLAMCLVVIALLASNGYVGWLFLDARQRYRGLLTRSFSFGQQTAEA